MIDAASGMQNLREAITGYRSRLMHESNEHKRNALLHVCLEYLERYYVLIAFTAYIMNEDFNPLNSKQPTFGAWIKERSELKRCGRRGFLPHSPPDICWRPAVLMLSWL